MGICPKLWRMNRERLPLLPLPRMVLDRAVFLDVGMSERASGGRWTFKIMPRRV